MERIGKKSAASTRIVLRYLEIYRTLHQEISEGTFKAGDQFPTEREIMARFNASRTTVRTALRLLHQEGLIESKQGSGTTVTALNTVISASRALRFTEIQDVEFYFAMESPWEESHSDALIEKTLANAHVAQQLEIPAGTEIYRIQWLHSVNGIPYNYLTHYMRVDFVPDLDVRFTGKLYSIYRLAEKEYGLLFTEAREDVVPVCANFMEASFLNVPQNTPLLKLCRIAYCQKGPLEYCESIINPDVLKITLSIGKRAGVTSV